MLNNKCKVKKLVAMLMSFVMLIALIPISVTAFADPPEKKSSMIFYENENLTQEQIDNRFNEINSRYSVGEPFSSSDADFIMKYAMEPGSSRNHSINFDKTGGSKSWTTWVNLSGNIWQNNTSKQWGGNAKVTVLGTVYDVTSIYIELECVMYGYNGTTISIVYHSYISGTSPVYNPASYSISGTKNITAIGALYLYLNASCTVSTTQPTTFMVLGC